MTRPQRKRKPGRYGDIWCSLGKHRSFVLPGLAFQYPGGTVCAKCQMEIAENLKLVVDMPEMSEAMYRAARERDKLRKAEVMQDRKRIETDPASTGYVYYIRINGQIKIGYTANLRQRSRNYPPGSELLAIEPGTRELERRRHEQFSRELARGREWFAESEKLTAHIAATAAAHGVPTELMHAFTKHEGSKHV